VSTLRRAVAALRDLWLVVGVTLLLLVVGEVAARVLTPSSPAPDVRIHADSYPDAPWVAGLYDENARSAHLRWESYAYWRRAPFTGAYINVDAHGHRRTWRAPAAPGATAPLRVFVFGGSTVWGTGVRDDHTVPSELARYLGEHGVVADVENFGETGYVSTQDVVSLLRALHRGDVPRRRGSRTLRRCTTRCWRSTTASAATGRRAGTIG